MEKGNIIVFEKVKVSIKDVDMGEVVYKGDHWLRKDAIDSMTNKEIGDYIVKKHFLDYGNAFTYTIKRTGEVREKEKKMEKGGVSGEYKSLSNKLLSQKIEMFLDKVKPYKFYFVDEKSNSLLVGFGKDFTQDAADKVKKEAESSVEFFDGNKIDMRFNSSTGDTLFTIPLKKKVKYGSGGDVDKEPNKAFFKWYISWIKKNTANVFVAISIPNEISSPIKEDDGHSVILDVMEKRGENNAAKYLKEITNKADEYGVKIYLIPNPRVYNLKSEEYKKKITKEYLIKYYSKFGFRNTGDFMVRNPKAVSK